MHIVRNKAQEQKENELKCVRKLKHNRKWLRVRELDLKAEETSVDKFKLQM